MKLDPAETIAMERTKRAHAATHPLISLPEPEAIDPQFVELFIEEAKEEIASVQKAFPLWDQNPMDLESLSSMRRSFHTLKGSGRMVGARSMAEFAWSIEKLPPWDRASGTSVARSSAAIAPFHRDGVTAKLRCP